MCMRARPRSVSPVGESGTVKTTELSATAQNWIPHSPRTDMSVRLLREPKQRGVSGNRDRSIRRQPGAASAFASLPGGGKHTAMRISGPSPSASYRGRTDHRRLCHRTRCLQRQPDRLRPPGRYIIVKVPAPTNQAPSQSRRTASCGPVVSHRSWPFGPKVIFTVSVRDVHAAFQAATGLFAEYDQLAFWSS